MATHSRILAWRILWTEEPGGLQSMGSERIGHDWSDLAAAAHLNVTIKIFFCLSLLYHNCFYILDHLNFTHVLFVFTWFFSIEHFVLSEMDFFKCDPSNVSIYPLFFPNIPISHHFLNSHITFSLWYLLSL